LQAGFFALFFTRIRRPAIREQSTGYPCGEHVLEPVNPGQELVDLPRVLLFQFEERLDRVGQVVCDHALVVQ
jgi:hypothetical protein